MLAGGWLRVVVPDLHFDEKIPAYSGNNEVKAAKASSPDFDGLAGLPLLRKFEYGGNSDRFWLKAVRKRK